MSTPPRKRSEGNVYHLIIRGVGQQIIFEDDSDRKRFMTSMHDIARERGVKLWAWSIMGNRVHLVANAPLEVISNFMSSLQSGYALYFNKRHNRKGKLFQGRFTSIPIENDEQLVTVVRYVHLNPVKAGESLDSPWSSYGILAAGGKGIENASLVLEVFGGTQGFKNAHTDLDETLAPKIPRTRLAESEAIRIAQELTSPLGLNDIKALPKAERNKTLRLLKKNGLSVRQIARITGIGQNIVARA